jgi:hypothetical protein
MNAPTYKTTTRYLLSCVVRVGTGAMQRTVLHPLSIHDSVLEAFDAVRGSVLRSFSPSKRVTLDTADFGCVLVDVEGSDGYQITRITHYSGSTHVGLPETFDSERAKAMHLDELLNKKRRGANKPKTTTHQALTIG